MLPYFRPIDTKECDEIHGIPLSLGLSLSVLNSIECYTVIDDGEPIGIFGITGSTDDPRAYTVWMIGTDRLTARFPAVARESREVWRRWTWRYGRLTNVLLRENTHHIRWLKWLGAEFEDGPAPDSVRFYSCA